MERVCLALNETLQSARELTQLSQRHGEQVANRLVPVPPTEGDQLPYRLDPLAHRHLSVGGDEPSEVYAASTTSLARKDSTSSLSGA